MASSHSPDLTLPKASDDKPMDPSGRKATKKTHFLGKNTSKTVLTDRLRPVTIEDVVPPRKRATRRAKAEVSDESNVISSIDSKNSSPDCSLSAKPVMNDKEVVDDSAIIDLQGKPLFDHDALLKPKVG
ncbi:Hypothetical predicted protein [Pelobates cultripes]|uniref:Uncharacterized protein n=1 Tax=Pelobates cultripes TaxID=61616 RepID=A0AAD1S8P7_PELCU|nr:Hypothetical predicted protein [Pelobates cultripes]